MSPSTFAARDPAPRGSQIKCKRWGGVHCWHKPPKLLERTQRGLIESRRAQAGALPTVQEFAAAIVDAAADARRPNGHVSFVGPTD
jgi:hypothetical protein